MSSVEVMLVKAHNKLMRHKETRAMCGIFVSGTNEIVDDGSVPTAATDGWNKYYGKQFMETLPLPQVTGIVLHENLHVFCKHMIRFRSEMKREPQMMNAAMDYAINAWILNLTDKTLATLPSDCLYDAQFKDWSVQEIYTFLKDGRDREGKKHTVERSPDNVRVGGKPFGLGGHDTHMPSPVVSPEQAEQMSQRVDSAIQQGAVLAGAMGMELPRMIKELLVPDVNWIDELAEYAGNTVRGEEDYSFRRLNRKYLGGGSDEMLVPTMINDVPSEIVIAIDTSCSISDQMLSVWGGIVARIMESVGPDLVRILWWDTRVHAEQVFMPNEFAQIAALLKPQGGGGTRVSCVSKYILDNNITADCVIVLTDGYVESNVQWDINSPTLWAVTEHKDWTPPSGRVLNVKL
jgi:predicted metal-dependent peptidase